MLKKMIAAALALLLLAGCGPSGGGGDIRVLVDGAAFKGGSLSPQADDDVRVYITRDGKPLLDLPFGEAHTVQIIQDGVGENTVKIALSISTLLFYIIPR